MTADQFLAWLRSHAEEPLEGCSEEDLAALMSAQGVSTLPPVYADFLRACGRDCYPFRKGTIIEYPLVAEAKEAMEECLAAHGDYRLGHSAFVFYCHQGYHFWFFPDVGREEIWEYSEGSQPEPFYRTFEDWLEAEVAYHDFVWAQLAAHGREEEVDWSRQFDLGPFRTLG